MLIGTRVFDVIGIIILIISSIAAYRLENGKE